jgi:hypothetical protein
MICFAIAFVPFEVLCNSSNSNKNCCILETRDSLPDSYLVLPYFSVSNSSFVPFKFVLTYL